MTRRRLLAAALRNDLQTWACHPAPWIPLALTVGAVALSVTRVPAHSVFRTALGGPAVVSQGGSLHVTPG